MAIQILKLGLSGSEVTLTAESRINNQGQDTFKFVSGEAADGSLKVDIIGTKKNFAVAWAVMSEANYAILYGIYNLQITGDTFLSYIETDSTGAETTTTVFMQPPTQGDLIQAGTFYSNGVSITMQEV